MVFPRWWTVRSLASRRIAAINDACLGVRVAPEFNGEEFDLIQSPRLLGGGAVTLNPPRTVFPENVFWICVKNFPLTWTDLAVLKWISTPLVTVPVYWNWVAWCAAPQVVVVGIDGSSALNSDSSNVWADNVVLRVFLGFVGVLKCECCRFLKI